MTNSEYMRLDTVFSDSGFSKLYFDWPWHLKHFSFSPAFLNLETSVMVGFSCSDSNFSFTGEEVSDVLIMVNASNESISNTSTTHAGRIFAL